MQWLFARMSIAHSTTENISTKLSMAILYASKGWRVHPLHHIRSDATCSCGSNKCKAGKHPRLTGWQKKATANPGQIRNWWIKHPNANIGIVLDDLIVIDVDPLNGGSLDEVKSTYPKLVEIFDSAYCVKTGEGFHFYFNGGFRVEKKNHLLGKGVDVLTGNHYAVAPPSNHASGNSYELIRDSLTSMPPVLRALIEPVGGAKIIANEIFEGQRNDSLASLAGKLRKQGWNENRVKIKLQETNELRCKPPLSYDEVEKIAESIMKMGETSKTSKKTRWQMAVSRDTRLADKQVRILFCLSHYMDAHGLNCFPSQDTLVEDAGCNRKTVSKHIEGAIKHGYLGRYQAGKGLDNHLGNQYGYIAKLPEEE